MKLQKFLSTTCLLLMFSFWGNTQTIWIDSSAPETELHSPSLPQLPTSYRLLQLNQDAFESTLKSVSQNQGCLEIPLPDGSFDCFEISPTAVMHPQLAAKYKHIKTFSGRSVNNPSSTLRMVWTSTEFHAFAFTEEGVLFVDKVASNDAPFYISYFAKNLKKQTHECGTHETAAFQKEENSSSNNTITQDLDLFMTESAGPYPVGTELRKYRMAMAVPGELTQSLGGLAAAMARVAILMNDLNAIVERDLCITFELIPNNDTLIYDNPATDPYSNGGLSAYLAENPPNINSTIGVANFDIGHVLNPTSGGVAYLNVFCNNSWKAGGTSANNLGVLAHEIGHQMGAGHTFNYCGSAGTPRVEPGDGNTIMSYHGICGPPYMPGGDLYQYHTYSYVQMYSHLVLGSGNTCATKSNTGHTPPTVTIPTGGFTIPISTPFALKGSATDDGGSTALTYLWEQRDISHISTHPSTPAGNAPTFRSFPYSSDSIRTFPELSKIINGTSDIGEVLPTYDRDYNFRLMVHDNAPNGGGVDYGHLVFHADENAGPFLVESPNELTCVWSKGQTRTVTWDVANTEAAPVSCATVNILASFDGGWTYPDTLAAAVPNDGSQDIIVPDTISSTVRIKVEAADNVFFDISDENFQIVSDTIVDFCLDISPKTQSICSGDSVTYQIDLVALGAFSDSLHLTLSNLPSGVVSNLPDSVDATASITLTLSNISGLAKGNYAMPFTAENADSSVSRSATIYLVIRGDADMLLGNSMSFDGNDYVDIPDIGGDYQFGQDQSFTVDFWLKTTSTVHSRVMVAKKDWSSTTKPGWLFYHRSGKVRWVVADGSDRTILESPITINDGEWHHITGVIDRSGDGKALIYVDGHLGEESGFIVPIKSVNNDLPIAIGSDSKFNYEFDGEFDEIRVWRKALSPAEIRENMHRVQAACAPDLISNWQFNENSGDALDNISHYNGTVTGASRFASTIPAGTGTAQSETESAGQVIYSGTDFSANYKEQDAADVTITKLNLAPHGTMGIAISDTIFNDQYWVANRYEQSGSLKTDMTFGLSENLTSDDVNAPFGLKLYQRDFNSLGNWTPIANGITADSTLNTVTFPDLTTYGQFLVTRTHSAAIGISKTNLDFCQTGGNPEVLSYTVSGLNLTDTLQLITTGDFEISLDSSTFHQSLALIPLNGVVASTKIFVRPDSNASNSEIGQIDHSSTGTATQTLNLSAFVIGGNAGNALSGSGGDYLSLPRNPPLIFGPNQDFSVELWVKTTDTNPDGTLISNKNWNSGANVGWGLFFINGKWKVNINGTGGSRVDANSTAVDINDGNWHHLAVVFDRDDKLKLFQDGVLIIQTSMAGINGLNIDAGYPINVLQDGTGTSNWYLDAEIDELRLWSRTLTAQEIRKNRHLTLSCIENNLTAYYQFNETSGDCLDMVGGHHGTLMNSANRLPSNMPAAGGLSVSKNIQLAQVYSFDDNGTDTNVDIDFSVPLPSDTLVLSYITGDTIKGNSPTIGIPLNHYWISDNHGNQNALGNVTFQVSEDVMPSEEAVPFLYQIFGRSPNSFGSWSLLTAADSVNAANNTLTFNQIPLHQQFKMVKDTTPNIWVSGTLNHFGSFETGDTSLWQSYSLSASNITSSIEVIAPTGYLISSNSVSGFTNSLMLQPLANFIADTTIYVRFNPSSVQSYSDSISHKSTGAITKYISVDGTVKGIGKLASNMLFGNNIDYISLPRDTPLIFGPHQDFTVELWLKDPTGNADPSIISNKNWASGGNTGWGLFWLGNQWKVNINADGGTRRDMNSNAPNLNDGKWHHIAVVFDRDNQMKMYQDGIQTNQIDISNLNGLNIDPGLPINIFQDGTGNYGLSFSAKIDELRLWNSARTTQEIREAMHLSLSGAESDLVAYYQFNQNTGDCLDNVGGHHGTLFNSPTRIASDVPVAGGISVTKDIQSAQVYSFDAGGMDTNLDIDFSGTLPLGEVVVSNLTAELPHGAPPSGNTMSHTYWIVNNYGSNTSDLTADMTFHTLNNWASSNTPSDFEIHKRSSNAIASESWDAPFIASAADSTNNKVTFSGINSFSQFILSKNFAPTCLDNIQNGDETGVDCGGTNCSPCSTCNDGIQNGDETGVDCGGSNCPACPTCTDGIQNGDETGIDCGGSNCPACPTCNDGIQNGNETGIDCGGSCQPCNMACTISEVQGDTLNMGTQTIMVSDSIQSTAQISGSADVKYFAEKSIILKAGFKGTNGSQFLAKIQDCTIDCFDGIQNGDEIGVDCGGSICDACPTCSDGIQNGDEAGIDCGGSNCPACPSCTDGVQNGNETGIDCGGTCAPCAAPCLISQILNDTIAFGSYLFNVTDTLTSASNYSGSANISYQAGKSIILKPGFTASSGVQFLAKIITCQPMPVLGNEQEPELVLSSMEKDLSTNMKETLQAPHILIYPNPAAIELQVQIKTDRYQPISMIIQNALGQQMHRSQNEINSSIFQAIIDVSPYPPGTYWLKVRFEDNGNWQVIQFVKH